jgi:hypothetical protein
MPAEARLVDTWLISYQGVCNRHIGSDLRTAAANQVGTIAAQIDG